MLKTQVKVFCLVFLVVWISLSFFVKNFERSHFQILNFFFWKCFPATPTNKYLKDQVLFNAHESATSYWKSDKDTICHKISFLSASEIAEEQLALMEFHHCFWSETEPRIPNTAVKKKRKIHKPHRGKNVILKS